MFGPLHERAEYQVIVYSYTKLTLLTVLLALPYHLSHKKNSLCKRTSRLDWLTEVGSR